VIEGVEVVEVIEVASPLITSTTWTTSITFDV